MDGVLNMKVPHFVPCYRTVTGNELKPLEWSPTRKNETSQDRQFSDHAAFGRFEQLQCAQPNTSKNWIRADC
jgi:hypothetical protein